MFPKGRAYVPRKGGFTVADVQRYLASSSGKPVREHQVTALARAAGVPLRRFIGRCRKRSAYEPFTVAEARRMLVVWHGRQGARLLLAAERQQAREPSRLR